MKDNLVGSACLKGGEAKQNPTLTFFVLPISKIVSSFSLSLFVFPFPPEDLFPELGLFARTMAGKERKSDIIRRSRQLCVNFVEQLASVYSLFSV